MKSKDCVNKSRKESISLKNNVSINRKNSTECNNTVLTNSSNSNAIKNNSSSKKNLKSSGLGNSLFKGQKFIDFQEPFNESIRPIRNLENKSLLEINTPFGPRRK
jgi:hypothetical protein